MTLLLVFAFQSAFNASSKSVIAAIWSAVRVGTGARGVGNMGSALGRVDAWVSGDVGAPATWDVGSRKSDEIVGVDIFGVTAGGELREAHPVNSPTMLKQRPSIAKWRFN